METIYKTFRAEVKDINEEDGTLNLFIPVSTDSVDRDGEVVEPLAFKKTLPKFMKRPVLVSSHDYRDLTSQIGEWTKLKITPNGIEGKPKYYVNQGNEQADWGFKLASKGMAAFSIGFIPTKWEDGDGEKTARRTFKEVELLEISQVIVPSNRDAIQSIRSKSVDPVINQLIDDISGAEIVDLTGKPDEIVTKPEETGEYIRIPVDSGNHEGHRIRTIEISAKEGISALYCGTDKVIMTYLFRKDKGWDMAKARAWVKDHEKSIIVSVTTNSVNDDEIIQATIQTDDIIINSPRAAQTSQEEIIDEFDYLRTLIVAEGMGEKSKEPAWMLIRQILRLQGSDIPSDIRDLFRIKSEMVAEDKLTSQDIHESIKRISIGGK